MSKTALITGVTGQDGAYLAKLLLQKGYRVIGAVRRHSLPNLARLEELGVSQDVELVGFELLEPSNIVHVIEQCSPDEVYNLAAQSFVADSFALPAYTADCDALGVVRLLEAIRIVTPEARFYQASTSEMFGKARETPQTELTPFHPRSPYGVAKLYGHWITVNYRESYGMHASCGVLFNHESPLRGQEFVTRKVTLGLARVKHGRAETIEIGNLNAKRDWGFAGDYVEGMWRMLQQPAGGEYVLATGETHSVREFVHLAAAALGFDLVFEGTGVEECGIDRTTGKTIVRINRKFYRPAEIDILQGRSRKAETQLGWKRNVGFPDLVESMAEADERRVRNSDIRF